MSVCLIALSMALWGGLLFLLGCSSGSGHLVARILAGALLVATGLHVARSRRHLLISPLFLLAVSAIVFFSLGTWVLLEAPLPQGWPHPRDWLQPGQLAAASRFTGGEGELVVLQFAVLALLATLLLDRMLSAERWAPAGVRVDEGAARPFVLLSFTLLILALLPFLLRQDASTVAGEVPGGLFRELLHAAPAAMSLAVAVLFLTAAGRSWRWLLLAVLGAALVCMAIFSTQMAKTAIFIALAGAGVYLIHSDLPLRRVAVFVIIAVVFFVTALTAVSILKPSSGSFSLQPANVYKHFVRKVFERQAMTAGCLQEVVEKRAPHGQGDSVFYFASSVVPRALWPDKPSLSRGMEYAFDYCGFTAETYSETLPHSASITLLGEPIVENGWSGLIVAQAVLVSLLFLATLVALNTGVLGVLSLVAMLPWLADFDHHFALYFALSTKMFLAMLPLILLYYVVGKRSSAAGRQVERAEGDGQPA